MSDEAYDYADGVSHALDRHKMETRSSLATICGGLLMALQHLRQNVPAIRDCREAVSEILDMEHQLTDLLRRTRSHDSR